MMKRRASAASGDRKRASSIPAARGPSPTQRRR